MLYVKRDFICCHIKQVCKCWQPNYSVKHTGACSRGQYSSNLGGILEVHVVFFPRGLCLEGRKNSQEGIKGIVERATRKACK